MKKTRLSTILLLVLTLLCSIFVLASCDGGDDKCTHQWGEWTATTNATCTEAGVQERKCSKCGETETSAINAFGHDWNEATCSTPKTCKTCSAIEGTTNAHAYIVETVKDEALKSAANCTSAAVYYKSCSCGSISTNDADTFTSGATLEHKDENTDHICDNNCRKNDMGTHADENKDHDCDYGCSKTLGEHTDSDDNNHLCDYGCGLIADDGCYDTVVDGKCDECGADIGHICVDENRNHACDICSTIMGDHADTNKDHNCEYGCADKIGTCADADKDHDCDYGCEKVFGTCEDDDRDHDCDYGCSKTFGTCEDADMDHDCDYGCTKTFGEHSDSNTDDDHDCDYGCKKAIEYTATFKVDDEIIDTVKYTIGTASITEPAVPTRVGYTGTWESYTLDEENITVNAVYTANEYTITFVSNGGTEIIPLTEYCGTEITAPEDPTRERYCFMGWFLESSDEAYVFSTMPTEDITLYAKWELYSLTLTYDETITAVSSLEDVTANSFGASCTDNLGRPIEITASVNGSLIAGETVTVRLSASINGANVQKTIFNVKVYGSPTLIFDDTVDYFNTNGGLTATHFGASGKDTFGASTKINVYVDGEYKAGDLVTVVIESVDPAGNITYGYIENVKAYGLPEITYNENKAAISVNDTLNAELFGATATDSFGEPLTVTAICYSGIIAAGDRVTICISATDSRGNVKNIDVECKIYDMPTISTATKTDVRVDDMVTPELLGITGTDTCGNPLTVTLTAKEGSQTAGTMWTVTATVIDVAGNSISKDFELKVYGTPTISYDREGVKVGEDATTNPTAILSAIATDSFGNHLTVTATVKSGSLTVGTYIVYTLTATDHLGNTATLETAQIGVYDINDINLTYAAGMSGLIKLTSKGEEFDAKATDSFGNDCDITIEAAEGCTLAGGKIISLYIVATDKAGNKVYSSVIENIKVYNSPTVTINQNNLQITEAVDINFLFTVYDSFGEELYANINVSGDQKAGNIITATVTATDVADNKIIKQYSFAVQPFEKSFVELYVDGEYWQSFFVEDSNSYSIPIPTIKEGMQSVGWLDANGNRYTDVTGKGILSLPEHIQLYYLSYTDEYLLITSVDELKNITTNSKCILFEDLDLAGMEWTPIGTETTPFNGTFDGNGHTISNFKITVSAQFVGLFGYNAGTIMNLGVEGITINVSGRSSSCYAGGLVGYNYYGDITNCHVTGSVNNASASSGIRESLFHAGGLVGYNYYGAITNCHTSVNVSSNSNIICSYGTYGSSAGGLVAYNYCGAIMNCYTTGIVKSRADYDNCAGGVIGVNCGGVVIKCYAIGNVSSQSNDGGTSRAGGLIGMDKEASEISNCYATGDVSAKNSYGDSQAGGLVGFKQLGNITNCYARGSVDARTVMSASFAGGLVGRLEKCTIANCYAVGDVNSTVTSKGSGNYNYHSYSGGLIGKASGNSIIKTSFAIGNISASAIENSFAGGLIADTSGTSITDCYRYSDSTIALSGSHTYNRTYGTAKSMLELQDTNFCANTLGWSADVWNFVEGTYPTLKNVGNTN